MQVNNLTNLAEISIRVDNKGTKVRTSHTLVTEGALPPEVSTFD